MEEKERYELNDNDCIIDNEKDVAICDVCDVSESPETLVDLLNQQDKHIKELEQDKTKFMDLLNSMTENWWVLYEENKKLRQENKQPKQQIAEKDRKIADLEAKLAEKERQLKLAEELLIKQEKEYDEQLEKQAKIHYKHLKEKDQDKILFAIDKLEKVKENAWQSATDISCLLDYTELAKIIVNQIKSLKGEK